jgi:RNA-dependent RNA polymerase
MLWIDLLRSSHMRSPGRLAIETIICLAENNVPHHVFETLLQDGVNQVVADLTTWDGKDAMYKLWRNVAKHGCVMSARMARQASGEARVRGLGDRDADGNELEDGEDLKEFANALIERSAAWWSDEISGCPSSLEETVLVLLDAGFVPQTCAVLKERLKVVMNTAISSYLKRCKLEVQMSCIALLVPGTLT